MSRPMLVVVLNCCVTEQNDTPRRSNISIIRAKSIRLRLSRSTRWTTTQSTLPASMSRMSRCIAGRSRLPPVYPPSAYSSASASQPWLLMYARHACCWACSELNGWSRPSSWLLRT